MLLQAGVDPENELTSAPAAEALGFFTAFAASQAVWDETLDNSTLAFARGIVGMYFGPSWRYFDIKALNPGLNFRVVAAPQLAGGETVNYAHFWAEAVSKKSKNPAAAWELLQYLASKEVLTKLYAAQSKLRGFGEPYPRLDMASLLTNDPVVGTVMAAAPTAKGWYLASFTQDGDTGINSRINKYFLDAVNGTLRGGDPAGALSTAAKGVSQVLGSYK
jgi:multiple sugar transport system substrate-binding protein